MRSDKRSEFGKLAGEMAKERFARLPEEQKQETIQKMVDAAGQKRASITPEEKRELIRKQQEGRLASLALKRLNGERTDHMAPETRRRIAQLGGLAAAEKKFANMSEDERKRLGPNLPAARAARAAKIQALKVPEKPPEPQHQLIRDRLISFPRTSGRKSSLTFCKLLCSVDSDVFAGGFGWHGAFFKPGQTVRESTLWPDRAYPPTPLVLECAGPCSESGELVYILWQLRERQWIEIGRSQSKNWEWAIDLQRLAIRALAREGYPKRQKIDILKLTERLFAMLDAAAMPLPKSDRESVFCVLHDGLAARVTAGMSSAIPAIAVTGDKAERQIDVAGESTR